MKEIIVSETNFKNKFFTFASFLKTGRLKTVKIKIKGKITVYMIPYKAYKTLTKRA